MTRNLPEPCPEIPRVPIRDERDALDKAVAKIRHYLNLHKRTGIVHIRVHSNQGGITAAEPRLEEPLS